MILSFNQLTDKTGVKLVPGRQLHNSSIERVGQPARLGDVSGVNSSLQFLYLFNNEAADQTHIDAAFVDALRLNPDRLGESDWWLFSTRDDFERLKHAAEQLGHPSLQLLASD